MHVHFRVLKEQLVLLDSEAHQALQDLEEIRACRERLVFKGNR